MPPVLPGSQIRATTTTTQAKVDTEPDSAQIIHLKETPKRPADFELMKKNSECQPHLPCHPPAFRHLAKHVFSFKSLPILDSCIIQKLLSPFEAKRDVILKESLGPPLWTPAPNFGRRKAP